jgi:2-polyprenyl-3-methyl-5-hydroxy-6-metoxy-1,4-benzoquinol methylase
MIERFSESAMTSVDRSRATVFGTDARQYDRARPSYPPALLDALVTPDVQRVLDVGCGTGIAARAFAASGCRVHGVEADVRMAEVARAHGLAVDVARFEDWDGAPAQVLEEVGAFIDAVGGQLDVRLRTSAIVARRRVPAPHANAS